MQFRTQYTEHSVTREKNSGKSITVQDQNLSIREIMLRHSRGVPLNTKTPLYHDESTIDTETGRNIQTMDISEVQDELEEINQRIIDRKEAARAAHKKQQEEKQEQYRNQILEQGRQEWEKSLK